MSSDGMRILLGRLMAVAPLEQLELPGSSLLTAEELQALSLAPQQQLSAPADASKVARKAADIWNLYGGMIEPLASKIGIDKAVAVAVIYVESRGKGMGPDGRLIIRFENHLFWRFWGQANAAAFNQFFRFNQANTIKDHQYRTQPDGPWLNVHTNQDSEWEAFAVAAALDEHVAKISISMGLTQILGWNHRVLGYSTPDAMFEAFKAGEKYHLLGFFTFVDKDQRQVTALRNSDFTAFARIYNGPTQPLYYGQLMKNVLDEFGALIEGAPQPSTASSFWDRLSGWMHSIRTAIAGPGQPHP